MAGVSYAAPWWVSLLHRLPHVDLRWEATSSQFRPEDTDYQQVTRGRGSGPRVTAPPPSRVTAPFLLEGLLLGPGSLLFQSPGTSHVPIWGPRPSCRF